MYVHRKRSMPHANRQTLVGGSDARIIMGGDEGALLHLWPEKRGEVEPEDLSDTLIIQLGLATEDLNRRWYGYIAGRMSVGRYIVALCYATVVILVGWWPWNILLILPVLLSRNHIGVFVTPEESLRSKVFCGRGGSL